MSTSMATAPATARSTKPMATVEHVEDHELLEPHRVRGEQHPVGGGDEPEARTTAGKDSRGSPRDRPMPTARASRAAARRRPRAGGASRDAAGPSPRRPRRSAGRWRRRGRRRWRRRRRPARGVRGQELLGEDEPGEDEEVLRPLPRPERADDRRRARLTRRGARERCESPRRPRPISSSVSSGKARQREHLARGARGCGKRPSASARAEQGLRGDGARVVDGRAHAEVARARRRARRAAGDADRVLVVHVPGRRALRGQRRWAARRARRGSAPATPGAPSFQSGEPLELDAQERRLELVEPARLPELDVLVLARRAVVAQPAQRARRRRRGSSAPCRRRRRPPRFFVG